MKLIDMAKALGDKISNSDEYARFLSAQNRYMLDEKAKELINTFKRKQQVLEFTKVNNEDADSERIKREINELFYEIEGNEVIQELNDSLNEFLILKQSIHEKIESTTYINEDILSLSKKCGGCKGSCGGCK